MTTLLILYPASFASKSKFDRKVDRIVGQMDSFEIVYTDDRKNFIKDRFADDKRVQSICKVEDLANAGDVTHAIIFDDGEEFVSERERLEQAGTKMRWVRTPITRVVNITREPQYKNMKCTPEYEYIGRGSYWGNPYSMHENGDSREEVIRKYKFDFEHECFPNIDTARVHELAGKRLGCFCKPAVCPGEVLADFLNSYDDGK